MRTRGMVVLGGFLIFFGLLALASNLFQVNFWTYCWPAGLILVGIWVLVRPNMVSKDTNVSFHLLGDVKRNGAWSATTEEFWIGIGSLELDLTNAIVPLGETKISVYSFVGDLKILIPANLGVKVETGGFISTLKMGDQKQDIFLTSVEVATPGYDQAERRLIIDTVRFVGDSKIKNLG